jgi:hypothetical protein
VVGVESFLSLTEGQDIDKGFGKDKLVGRMREAYKGEIQSGVLSEKEVEKLTQVVLSDMDKEDSGRIELQEFLSALTSEECMSHQDLGELFDVDRSRGILEKIFSDSRLSVIRKQQKGQADKVSPEPGPQAEVLGEKGASPSPAPDPPAFGDGA